MPRCRLLSVAVVLVAACSPNEATEPDTAPASEALAAPIAALAEQTGESTDALSQDPCVIGCAGAVVEGCSTVKDTCDTALVAPFSGVWITCTEAVMSACGGTAGLGLCTLSCRARDGRQ
jgi:hypothetical protein